MNKLKLILAGFVLGLVTAGVIVAWKAAQIPMAVPGKTSKPIAGIVPVPETRIVYIYRDTEAAKKLGVPGQDILTSVKTDKGTATATLDKEGKAHIFLQTDPLPWFKPVSSHSLAVAYGRNQDEIVNQVAYKWTFLEVKRAAFYVGAEADTGANRFIGVGIRISW